MHMEHGSKLVLRDTDIFGALYDMLNQNYSRVGGRNHCRIALGAHSNPMCSVHEQFRCVVLMHPQQAEQADPSLLNRFEKQWLECEQLLPPRLQQQLLQPLTEWAAELVEPAGATACAAAVGAPGSSTGHRLSGANARAAAGANAPKFSHASLWAGWHPDTLPSLILQITDNGSGLSETDPSGVFGRGLGLSNIRDRLMQLYGDRQQFSIVSHSSGGAEVTLRVPLHTSVQSAPTSE